jgi:mRNA interferase YafQ
MFELERTKQFKKDIAKLKMKDKEYKNYIDFVTRLIRDEILPPEAKDHSLIGNYKNHRELHISNDLLLIYYRSQNCIRLVRIGSHSQLFL